MVERRCKEVEGREGERELEGEKEHERQREGRKETDRVFNSIHLMFPLVQFVVPSALLLEEDRPISSSNKNLEVSTVILQCI